MFNHLGLKFNHGVEIGARLAYLGHYKRTQDPKILEIANDELEHQKQLKKILNHYGYNPSKIINGGFLIIGSFVFLMCQVSPIWSLNLVACVLEKFAVVSYKKLALNYKEFKSELISMEQAEAEHEIYFKTKK